MCIYTYVQGLRVNPRLFAKCEMRYAPYIYIYIYRV